MTKKYTCSICNQCLAAGRFSPRTDVPGAVDLRCKRCQALRQRERRSSGLTSFSEAKAIARRTGRDFLLTREEYAALRGRPCHYCGYQLPLGGLALDRLDTEGDYSLDNVVPCCAECNLFRGLAFTVLEMIERLGPAMADIKALRAKKGEVVSRPFVQRRGRPRKYEGE